MITFFILDFLQHRRPAACSRDPKILLHSWTPRTSRGELAFPLNSGSTGFTLIEVLIALVIVAIAFTALLHVTAQNLSNTQRLKEKTISHWVAKQGVVMMQLGLLKVMPNATASQVTQMLGQNWYWQAKIKQTPIRSVQEITITVSKKAAGPFIDPLIAYRYL